MVLEAMRCVVELGVQWPAPSETVGFVTGFMADFTGIAVNWGMLFSYERNAGEARQTCMRGAGASAAGVGSLRAENREGFGMIEGVWSYERREEFREVIEIGMAAHG